MLFLSYSKSPLLLKALQVKTFSIKLRLQLSILASRPSSDIAIISSSSAVNFMFSKLSSCQLHVFQTVNHVFCHLESSKNNQKQKTQALSIKLREGESRFGKTRERSSYVRGENCRAQFSSVAFLFLKFFLMHSLKWLAQIKTNINLYLGFVMKML